MEKKIDMKGRAVQLSELVKTWLSPAHYLALLLRPERYTTIPTPHPDTALTTTIGFSSSLGLTHPYVPLPGGRYTNPSTKQSSMRCDPGK